MMKTSEKGLSLIKQHENLRLEAYLCPAGVWTIGYGHTLGVKKGMTITREIAEKLLAEDIAPIERALNALGLNLRQGQFDALVSFIFNVGIGLFNTSTLKRKLIDLNKQMLDVASEFARWNKATVDGKKVVLPGLTRRRAEEATLFMQQ